MRIQVGPDRKGIAPVFEGQRPIGSFLRFDITEKMLDRGTAGATKIPREIIVQAMVQQEIAIGHTDRGCVQRPLEYPVDSITMFRIFETLTAPSSPETIRNRLLYSASRA